MLSPKLASRYAKSLMDLSKKEQKEDRLVEDMKFIKETISGSSELFALLKSPIIHSDKKVDILNAIFSKHIDELTSKFITLLVNKGREPQLKEIVDSFLYQYNSNHNIVNATLTTAVEVDQKTLDKVKALILEDENIKDVILKTKIKPSIVGGFILQYDDKRLDNSVARKLQLIKNKIQDKTFISNL